MTTRNTKPVTLCNLEIDERFLEEFDDMTSGWNPDEDDVAEEAGRMLLHIFSRISIQKGKRSDGSTGWVLTVFDGEPTSDLNDA